ncbi:hypothetical protein [Alienimonas californiensis]|uniref:hypothetical protein n=1 Tax=Alienimonas californiensis TaxID=2527989 RepID=UPI0011A87574|nr:hypothetical protein [Alienimonas californiensis]
MSGLLGAGPAPAPAQEPVELRIPEAADPADDATTTVPELPDAVPGRPRFFTDPCGEACAVEWTATAPGDLTPAQVKFFPEDGAAEPGCAQAVWIKTQPDMVLRFDRALPPSAAIDELTASVAVFTTLRCAAAVRVSFPNAIDPNTGLPATAWIAGRPSPAATFAWRTLTTATTEAALNDARRRVRLSLGPDPTTGDAAANLTGAVVDRAGVLLWTDGGTGGPAPLRVDDLRVGPLVPVGALNLDETAEAYVTPPDPKRRVIVNGGRVTLDGEPFFPRLTFAHEVDPALLAISGFNLIQVRDWRDRDLLDAIAAAGMGAAAQPPSPGEAGAGPADLNEPVDAGLAPFGPGTDAIWLWNLGPRIPGEPAWVAATEAWVDAVRAADTARDRPTLIGVTGSERAYSRLADLLGVSRMVLGTALPLWEHTALLREVADRKARPGEPLFTWIQTAPHGRTAAMREAAGLEPAVLEPELITRQALGAVAAGVKGLGYWITEPLDDSTPGRTERRLALTLTNLQLAAVEPILASATNVAPLRILPATTGDPREANRTRGSFGAVTNLLAGSLAGDDDTRGVGTGGQSTFGGGFGRTASLDGAAIARGGTGATDARPAGQATGALLSDGADRLVVAVWHGEDDQFVPGPAPFTSATFTVPGALATATAWRITPTSVSSLPHEQVTGGMRVTVPNFGDGAIVLVTPNHQGVNHLRRRVAKLAPGAATAAVHLARLKIERTRVTDVQLRPRVFDGRELDALLRSAESKLDDAERMLKQHDWDRAFVAAELARRFARSVQRIHWDRLVTESRLNGIPNASPHLIAFSTLPDHVLMMQRVGFAGRGRPVALLPAPRRDRSAGAAPLPSSEDEDSDDPAAQFDGRVYYGAPASIAAAAVLDEGELQLSAQPKTGYDRPTLLDRGLVVVETAPVDIPAGHAAVIRGEVKISGPILGNGEGVTVHDSWAEELGGLRWTGEEPAFEAEGNDGWAPFILIRPLPPAPDRTPRANPDGTRPITVTFGLHGVGVARFRGVTVEAANLSLASPVEEAPEPVPAPMPRLLDRLGGALRRF